MSGEPPETLAAALAAFQKKLPTIRKSETARVKSDKGNYSYTYANLADISAEVMPLLGEFGLSFLAMPTFSGDRFVLAYELLHSSGQSKSGEYPLPVGGTPQALGSAITYGRRYCLCAVTGVSPADDDDDGKAAQAHAERPPRVEKPAVPVATLREHLEAAATTEAIDLCREEGWRGYHLGAYSPDEVEQIKEWVTSARTRVAQAKAGEETQDPDRATEGQHKQMHVLWKKAELTDRNSRLAFTSEAVGRPVASSKELTKAEAATVIGKLTAYIHQSEPTGANA